MGSGGGSGGGELDANSMARTPAEREMCTLKERKIRRAQWDC